MNNNVCAHSLKQSKKYMNTFAIYSIITAQKYHYLKTTGTDLGKYKYDRVFSCRLVREIFHLLTIIN
jgi:hypothetical protein